PSIDAAQFARHLRQCSDCSAMALESVQMKRSLAAAGKRYAPSADFRSKVLGGVTKRPSRQGRWAWRILLAPVAIVVILSTALGLYVARERTTRDRVYGELADLHVS